MDAANIQPHEALGVRTRLLITMIEVFKKAGMDLKQLEYFVRVAELGNFTRAAQALDVVQPALSRQVRRLRQNLLLSNGRCTSNSHKPACRFARACRSACKSG